MREQLKQYVNLLFAGAEDCEDVRQEILQNTLDRYDDLIAQGKVPEAAYRLAISGIGDINEILGTPTSSPAPEVSPSRKNRKRLFSVLLAISVSILAVLGVTIYKSRQKLFYVMQESPAEAQVYQKAVATTQLSVRSSPNLNASVLATVPNGETVLIGHWETINDNDWAYILGSTNGWVSMEFLELLPQDTTGETSVSEVVTVYKMPNVESEVVASFAKGDPVTIDKAVTIDGKSWVYIHEPVAGWVMAEELDDATLSDCAAQSFYSYDEFSAWIEEQEAEISALVEAGEWPQEDAEERVAYYHELLEEIKNGLQIAKSESDMDELSIVRYPDRES